ncbi:hypothetical protein NDU88_003086 [Pleurodeles waltl]|uniref:Uncharacterized protein n=1 Tax=Pleurodeles waltl TaxID=8319 RepID=A0AAV7NFU1_PLEWA|nr:hypothetical protein NDU88_003086 [Pleurodeles waltl]
MEERSAPGIRQARKDSTIKYLFTKSSEKKNDRAEDDSKEMSAYVTVSPEGTRPFLESFFSMLRDDIAALKQELAADVKDFRRNMGEMEQTIDPQEQIRDSGDKELEEHRRKILILRNKAGDLNYQLEDFEKRLRRCNIRIKGVLLKADAGKLEEYVLRLFCHLAPALADQEVILNRTHSAGHPAQSPWQSQDILTSHIGPDAIQRFRAQLTQSIRLAKALASSRTNSFPHLPLND